MADITLVWDEEQQYCDINLESINNGKEAVDLTSGDDLITAVMVSLLSDRVANDDWSYSRDKRGWWGDAEISSPLGSRLWQLSILPVNDDQTYLAMAEGYVTEALEWLIEDSVCKEITCTASFLDSQKTKLNLDVKLTKPDDSVIRYGYVWDQEIF